jgi:MbtH protein
LQRRNNNFWSAFVADPFENADASYLVLVNQLGQHSLWPEAIDVPSGWQVVSGPGGRRECLDYVAANWSDIAPKGRSSQLSAP